MTRVSLRQDSRNRLVFRRLTVGSPSGRASCLAAVLAGAGLAMTLYAGRWARLPTPVPVGWWLLIPAFVLSNTCVLHLEVREEAHTFTLSELPLIVGLFFVSPVALIAGRLIGESIYFGGVRRQEPLKLVFNLAMFWAETAAATVVFRSLYTSRSPLHAASWLPVVAAVAVADLIGTTAVAQAIRWHGGDTSTFTVLRASAVTAVVNATLSLLAVIVLWVAPVAMILFAVIAFVTGLAYRSYARLRQRHTSLQVLYDFTRAVGASMQTEDVMAEVLAEARKLLRAVVAEVVLVDSRSGEVLFRQRASDGESEPGADRADADRSELIWRQVMAGGQSLLLPRSGRSSAPQAILSDLGVRDAIIAPLRSDDRIIGTLMVANRQGQVSSFDTDDARLFETLANHASVAFENGRLVERLRREAAERRYEALHDALTGLANRTLFAQEVEGLPDPDDPGRRWAVMLMDLDRFKEVNDTLGHHNGDLMLCEVAARLVATVRPTDTVARLGGDEFAVLLPGLTGEGEAEEIAARIVLALTRSFLLEDLSLEIGVSIGIAYSPRDGDDAATLLQRADVAMYDAKTNKRGVAVYSSERDTYSPRRLALAGELRQAIRDGEVAVYYQPKARLSDGEVIGSEALVRWRHRVHGFLPPDQFIPIAEHTGLISILTDHVLTTALRQCATWRDAGHRLGVAVNLAMRSLQDDNLPHAVAELLQQFAVPAEQLTLELTESSIMGDPDRTITVLERLAAIGVRLSVDDFGTGYSSLAYLQRLPVSEVKIDKSFVLRMASDANDATIVQSIIELGHNLKLSVVAEGIEDQVSWDQLRSMSCDVAQGYYLSRPVPALEITEWLNRRLSLEGVLLGSDHMADPGGTDQGSSRGVVAAGQASGWTRL